jgi:hypothetical protein
MQDISTLQPLVRELAKMLVDEVRSILADDRETKEEFLTPAQAAAEIGRSPTTVRGWCKAGLLGRKVSQPGSKRDQFLIVRDELKEFLSSRAPEAPAAPRRQRKKREPGVIEFFSE